MIEEHVSEGHLDLESFGKTRKIESTYDLIQKLRKDEKYTLDHDTYVKARLFDMLIGDWDRHVDQWRWAEFDGEDGEKVYRAIPRDRDQAYSYMGGWFCFLALGPKRYQHSKSSKVLERKLEI